MTDQETIAEAWASIIRTLGYDLRDPHLQDSPTRVAKFMLEWHTMRAEPPQMTRFDSAGHDEMVVVRGITFHSLCAHHGLPFFGEVAIGYIPRSDIVGLSKLARVVRHYANRFQVQERLTTEIADRLEHVLDPRGLGVVIRASHMCMAMRGIRSEQAETVTSDMRGALRESGSARNELLELIKR